MSKTFRSILRVLYLLLIFFVNVQALLFLFMLFSRSQGMPPSIHILPGRYGMLYPTAAVFAPACITLSLGALLRRAADISNDFLRRLFRTELVGLIVIFLLLLLLRYLSLYR